MRSFEAGTVLSDMRSLFPVHGGHADWPQNCNLLGQAGLGHFCLGHTYLGHIGWGHWYFLQSYTGHDADPQGFWTGHSVFTHG